MRTLNRGLWPVLFFLFYGSCRVLYVQHCTPYSICIFRSSYVNAPGYIYIVLRTYSARYIAEFRLPVAGESLIVGKGAGSIYDCCTAYILDWDGSGTA